MTSATTVSYRVIFSENVMGISTNAFQLTANGTVSGTVASVSGSQGTSVDVVVTNVTGDGTLRLDVKTAGTGITDLAGNALSGWIYATAMLLPSITRLRRLLLARHHQCR